MCYDRTTQSFGFLSDHDASDVHTVCHRLDDVYHLGGLARLLWQLGKLFKSTPPPPPP